MGHARAPEAGYDEAVFGVWESAKSRCPGNSSPMFGGFTRFLRGLVIVPNSEDVQLQASCHTHPSPSSPTHPHHFTARPPLAGAWEADGHSEVRGASGPKGGAGNAVKRVKSGTDRSCWNVLEGASPDTHGPALAWIFWAK